MRNIDRTLAASRQWNFYCKTLFVSWHYILLRRASFRAMIILLRKVVADHVCGKSGGGECGQL